MRAARPPAAERARRWNAQAGALVTKAVVAVNLAVFVLTVAGGGRRGPDLDTRLAVFGPAVADGEIHRLVTSGFVHFGLLHLAFNMVLLYRFGSMLEDALGRVRFLVLFLASLLGGSFGALLLTPDAFTGGASGAVFGVIAAAAIGLRRSGVDVWQSGVGGLLAVNLLLTFVIPGISVGGHLGGMAAGALVGGVVLRPARSRAAVWQGAAFGVAVSLLAVAGSVWTVHA